MNDIIQGRKGNYWKVKATQIYRKNTWEKKVAILNHN